jgi:PKD repeat protein
MKKANLIWIFLLCVNLSAIDVNPAAGAYTVGQNLSFRPTLSLYDWQYYAAQWNFGDGFALSQSPGNLWVSHRYRNPGSYWITLRPTLGSGYPPAENLSITINENRAITASPANPVMGQPVTFNAINFNTPTNIRWDFGDGTVQANLSATVTHTFSRDGTYTVRAFDWDGDLSTLPVVTTITVSGRYITFSPPNPREEQIVTFTAVYFRSNTIDWNFGDGSTAAAGPTSMTHRFNLQGTYTVSAKETGMSGVIPASAVITVLPDNRSVIASTLDGKIKESITFRAVNFRGPTVKWNFGDGTVLSNQGTVVTHIYRNAGTYTIRAGDENGASTRRFEVVVRISGISDLVNLLLAEITLDNGKYYKVVPKNSRNIKAVLKMKMKGTGIVSGYWIVDDQPYEFFNETAYQGEIKTIYTKDIPGLPVLQSGMHTVTVQLTRPAESVTFPYLRYFVLPYENVIRLSSPQDASVVKEKEIPEFTWDKAIGASRYQISFSNALIQILNSAPNLSWKETSQPLSHTPDSGTWTNLRRNQWVYWKVRALDSLGNIVAESQIQEIKIIVPEATITVTKIADLDGREIKLENQTARSKMDTILVQGNVEYQANAEFLILRAFSDNELVDQLLFRDMKKGEKRFFETSIQNQNPPHQVVFQVVKSSSPSLVIGFQEITLEKSN